MSVEEIGGIKFGVKLDLDPSPYLKSIVDAVKAFDDLKKAGEKAEDGIGVAAKKAEKEVDKLKPPLKETQEELKKTGKSGQDELGKIGTEAKKSEVSLGGLASSITGIYGKLAGLAGMAMGLIGGIGLKEMSEAAGEMEEASSRFGTVFGVYAEENRKFVEDYASTVGRSRMQMTGLMADTQDFFTSMGFGRAEAAQFSQTISRLTIDVAAFSGASEATVLENFQRAVGGAHGAVRKYGVDINEVTLAQKLLTMGIAGGVEAASEEELAVARLNMIIQATASAHGEAAGSLTTFTGRMTQLRSVISDLAVEMGQSFNKAIVEAIDSMGGFEKVEEILRVIFDTMVQLGKVVVKVASDAIVWIADWIETTGGAVAIHLKLLSILEQTKIAFAVMSSPIKDFILGVSTVFNGLIAVFQTLWETLKLVTNAIGGALRYALAGAARGVALLLQGLSYITPDILGGEAIAELAESIYSWADGMGEWGSQAWDEMGANAENIKQAWVSAGDSIAATFDRIDYGNTFDGVFEAADKSNELWDKATQTALAHGRAAKQAAADWKEAFSGLSELNLPGGARRGSAPGAAATRSPGTPGVAGGAAAGGYGGYYPEEADGESYGGGYTGSNGPAWWVGNVPVYSWSRPARNWTGEVSGGLSVPTGFAEGGQVGGLGDTIPALLTPGEFVVKQQQAQSNLAFLQALNSGRYSSGGASSAPPVSMTRTQEGASVVQHNQMNFYTQSTDPRAVANELARLARQGKRLGAV